MVHVRIELSAVSAFASLALGGHHTDVVKLAYYNINIRSNISPDVTYLLRWKDPHRSLSPYMGSPRMDLGRSLLQH